MPVPLYWIVGPEPLQQQDHLQRIRAQVAQDPLNHLRQSVELSLASDWSTLTHDVISFNDLFAQHRLIECHVSGKLPKEAIEFLQQFIEHPTEGCLLVFIVEKNEFIKPAACQLLMKRSTVYWARACVPGEFNDWIKNRSKKYQLKLEHGAILCLARYTEGNLLAANQFLEKLSILKQGLITEKEIVHYLSNQMHGSLFELTDMVFSGNTEKTFKILANLSSRAIEPVLILWAITREVRIITEVAKAVQSGTSPTAACERQGVWGKRAVLYTQVLDLIPLHRLYTLLVDAQAVDTIIKGFIPGNAYQALARLLFKLDAWLNKDRGFVA